MARDISPYSCIFGNCSKPDEMYVTTNDLLQHFRTEHGVRCWICDHCSMQTSDPASFIFETSEEWATHMSNLHHEMLAKIQSSALSKLSTRVMLPPVSCPLCGYSTSHPSAVLDNHIAQHLHSFALKSLPWGLEPTSEEDDRLSNQASEPQSTSKMDVSMVSREESSIALKNWQEDKTFIHLQRERQSLTETSVSMIPPEESNISLQNWLDDGLLSHLTEDPQSTANTMSVLSHEEINTVSVVRKILSNCFELS